MSEVMISLIVPTRAREQKLQQFLDSLAATTAKRDRVEVILVVDQDDTQTLAFQHSAMPCKMVTVPPGQTMGALNRAGYAATSGDFIMLLNDDVIVRTHAWDEKILEVFRAYPDGVVLVHVNDLIFQEKLCTFPFVTRTYCEIAGSICPEDYARYRIDDHIYNVFNLLALLGKKRIIYLPEIVFEHTNTGAGTGTDRYVPIPEIHAADTQHFNRLLASRKELAIELAEIIDRHLSSQVADMRRKLLVPVEDSVALRRPEFVTVRQEDSPLSSQNTRVTIGVVSADLRNAHARTCIDTIKQHTVNYDLIILDNNCGPGFNHSREMNRIRSICRTDFLLLMDDDVFVEPGWLDNLLRCMTPQTGVVTPIHLDQNGALSYAGVVMSPDRSGHHTHSFRVPEKPEPIQTLCSAVMLIDMTKCGHISIDESYSKYFLDIDYGLRIWESGYQVVLSPYVMATHIGGATLQQGSMVSNELFETQRAHFVREWIASGRYDRLESGAWKDVPEILRILALPGDTKGTLHACFDDLNAARFSETISQILLDIEPVPTLQQWVHSYIGDFLQQRQATIDPSVRAEFEWLKKSYLDAVLKLGAKHPVHSPQFLATCGKYNLVRFGGTYWAIPLALGPFDLTKKSSTTHPKLLTSDSLDDLRGLVLGFSTPGMQAKRRTKRSGLAVQLFRLLRNERERHGGWWAAGKIAAKRVIRRAIISTCGNESFQSWKGRWRRIRAKM